MPGVATFQEVSIIFAFNGSATVGRYGRNHVRGPRLVGRTIPDGWMNLDGGLSVGLRVRQSRRFFK